MMKQVRLLFIFLTITFSVFSQVDVNEQCKLAYEDILALRFDDAEEKLAEEKEQTPKIFLFPTLKTTLIFSRFLSVKTNCFFMSWRTTNQHALTG